MYPQRQHGFQSVIAAFSCIGDLSSWSCVYFFQIIPTSMELNKRAFSSTTDEELPAHQLPRDTSERCLSKISFSSGLPGLSQPFPSSGYVPYYRTEGELCIGPALGHRFFTRIEGLENKEGGQGEETGTWSLCSSCLVS